jgi:PAS domain S-box-containing protein
MVSFRLEDMPDSERYGFESTRLFSDIFYKSPVIFIISVPFKGKIIDVNESFLQSTEYSRNEVIGKTSVELGLFRDMKDREKMYELLKTNGSVLGYDCCFKTKSGRDLFGLISMVIIQIKDISFQFTTMIDISQRVKAEDKIRDQFKELRRWHEAILNREKRIMELKREVNELLSSNGLAIRYASVEEDLSRTFKPGSQDKIS